MSFAIAAAGTGGHVFPGLAVGEALVDAGVDRADILYVGGERLESTVYPDAGFPFLEVELRGLKRSLDFGNLAIPFVVGRAVATMRSAYRSRGVGVVLGMGGYVTVPAAIAARLTRAQVMAAEQNAHAGLGSRFAARMAVRVFGSFPNTEALPKAQWVGNPIRSEIAEFDRDALRPLARRHFALDTETPTIGVFGGSLGARALNDAAIEIFRNWDGPQLSVVHLAGSEHAAPIQEIAGVSPLVWRVVPFEERMDLFYAACDLVVARAGGAVAELTATGTPAILVPGGFGSAGHQRANATVLAQRGAALVVDQSDLGRLGEVVVGLLTDESRLASMRAAATALARPDAARVIASAMMDAHG